MKTGLSPMPSRTVMNAVWLFLLGAICLQILVQLVHVSMFFDGGIYASVARNLAEGRGTMWAPYFSDWLFPTFAEHPPLMFWLQAIGYSVFGDTIVVEKTFSLLNFIISALLLFQIWMRLNRDDLVVQQAFPLALFMALIAGRLNWGFANGLLDNLLAVFSLSAILLIVIACEQATAAFSAKRLAILSCAGLFICLSLMTKGPVGLFPLAAPAICWLVFRRSTFPIMILDCCAVLLVILIFLAGLYSYEPSYEAFQRYFKAQLFASLSGGRGYYGGGVYVFRKILGINGYSLVILALAAFASWRFQLGKSDGLIRRQRLQRAAFLIMVGMSASLPIGLSPRVANFYFNTSLFFYSAGFAILAGPALVDGLSRLTERQTRIFKFSSILFLAVSVVTVLANIGRPGVDARPIAQAAAIEDFVCSSKPNCSPLISVCQTVWQDSALHTYLQRFYKISIAEEAKVDADFVIADETCNNLPGRKDTGIAISPYRLLERE